MSVSKELAKLVQELFVILETKEESDEGRIFNPTTIGSCRVMETEKLRRILPKMKELAGEICDTDKS